MTIQTHILRQLNGSFVPMMTNQELAIALGVPEPSVRRTTRWMVENGLLHLAGTYGRANDYTLTQAGKRAARA